MSGGPVPLSDPGLQPERTIFAWNRTMVSFLAAAAVLLRWVAHHGAGVLLLVALSSVLALAIFASQRSRYRKMAWGVEAECVGADVLAVLLTSGAVMVLGAGAIAIVAAS